MIPEWGDPGNREKMRGAEESRKTLSIRVNTLNIPLRTGRMPIA